MSCEGQVANNETLFLVNLAEVSLKQATLTLLIPVYKTSTLRISTTPRSGTQQNSQHVQRMPIASSSTTSAVSSLQLAENIEMRHVLPTPSSPSSPSLGVDDDEQETLQDEVDSGKGSVTPFAGLPSSVRVRVAHLNMHSDLERTLLWKLGASFFLFGLINNGLYYPFPAVQSVRSPYNLQFST